MAAVRLPSVAWRVLFLAVFVGSFFCRLRERPEKSGKHSEPSQVRRHHRDEVESDRARAEAAPKGSEKEVAHLLVKNGTDTIDIYACPQSFLADMGINFSKGDEIALTGSKVKRGEADLVLAREVVKGTDTLVLRDDKGSPSGAGTTDKMRVALRRRRSANSERQRERAGPR